MLGSECHPPQRKALPEGVADSAELDILARVFNDYCARHQVTDMRDREAIAHKIMCLFRRGLDPSLIPAELES
jgi:hypothetical protein